MGKMEISVKIFEKTFSKEYFKQKVLIGHLKKNETWIIFEEHFEIEVIDGTFGKEHLWQNTEKLNILNFR